MPWSVVRRASRPCAGRGGRRRTGPTPAGRRRPGRDVAGADPDGRGGGREAAAAEAGAPCEERLRPADAVAGPLGLHGVSAGDPAEPGFRARLDGPGTGCGTEPPPEIHGIPDRLEPAVAEPRTLEAEKAAALKASKEAFDSLPAKGSGTADAEAAPDRARCAAALVRLRGIGANGTLIPGNGLSCRDLRSRRQPVSLAGPAPVPFAGGGGRGQETSRAGSPMPRRHPVRMAWRWLPRRPDSVLPKRFRDRVSVRDGRSRKLGTVALVRRLPAALWRYATAGPVPEGAVLPKA